MEQGNKRKSRIKGKWRLHQRESGVEVTYTIWEKTYGNLLSYKARKLELPSACHKRTSPEVKGWLEVK